MVLRLERSGTIHHLRSPRCRSDFRPLRRRRLLYVFQPSHIVTGLTGIKISKTQMHTTSRTPAPEVCKLLQCTYPNMVRFTEKLSRFGLPRNAASPTLHRHQREPMARPHSRTGRRRPPPPALGRHCESAKGMLSKCCRNVSVWEILMDGPIYADADDVFEQTKPFLLPGNANLLTTNFTGEAL